MLIIVMIGSYPSIFGSWNLQTNGLGEYTGNAIALDAFDSLNAVFVDQPLKIFVTANGGEMWYGIDHPNSGALDNAIDVSMPAPNHIWIVMGDPPVIWHTPDTGGSWEQQYYDRNTVNWFNYIEMFDTLNGVAMGDAASFDDPAVFLVTEDGGQSWAVNQFPGMPSHSYNVWNYVDFANLGTGYFLPASDNVNAIWKTQDTCRTWQLYETDEGGISHPVIKFYNENVGVMVGVDYLLTTSDGGASWARSPKPSSYVYDVEFSPGNESAIWLGNRDDLFFTSSGGAEWDTLLSNIPGEIHNIKFVNRQNGWVLGSGGIYHTSDGGTHNPSSIRNSPNRNFVCSAYPNPFNPSTTIDFQLFERSEVSLIIYDLAGREVQRLVSSAHLPGSYSANWYGNDQHGHHIPAGTYFARLHTGQYSSVIKMVYLR